MQPDTNFFQDKKVLVTGASRGIGRAIALHFAQSGADIVVNFFRQRKAAENTASEILATGRQALVVKANLGDLKDLRLLFHTIEQEFGSLNIVVHNAASGYNRPALEQKVKGWDWTMNINARSLLFLTQYAVPLMEKNSGGSIVAISSPGSHTVLPDYVVVGASKAAIETVVRYLAVELAARNINVNAVSPGIVLTEALKYFDPVKNNNLIIEQITRRTPAKRLVTPEDVAGVVAFLCSPTAQMIRGQVISVDGGISLLGPSVIPPGNDSD